MSQASSSTRRFRYIANPAPTKNGSTTPTATRRQASRPASTREPLAEQRHEPRAAFRRREPERERSDAERSANSTQPNAPLHRESDPAAAAQDCARRRRAAPAALTLELHAPEHVRAPGRQAAQREGRQQLRHQTCAARCQRSAKRVDWPNTARASTNSSVRSSQGLSQNSSSDGSQGAIEVERASSSDDRRHRRAGRTRSAGAPHEANAEVGRLQHRPRPQIDAIASTLILPSDPRRPLPRRPCSEVGDADPARRADAVLHRRAIQRAADQNASSAAATTSIANTP